VFPNKHEQGTIPMRVIFPTYAFNENAHPGCFSKIFRKAHHYSAGDVNDIHTSTHYSNVKKEGSTLSYTRKTGYATRNEEGDFNIFILETNVEEGFSEILQIPSLASSCVENDEYNVTCRQSDVIQHLTELNDKLSKKAEYSKTYRGDSLFECLGKALTPINSLHLHVATEIFADPRTEEQIKGIMLTYHEFFTLQNPVPLVAL